MKWFNSHICKKVSDKRLLVCSFIFKKKHIFQAETRFWKPFGQLEELILELRHGLKFTLESKWLNLCLFYEILLSMAF